MRILVTSHEPIDDAASGLRLSAVALAFQAAGHCVRAIVVDSENADNDSVPTRRIICRHDDPVADLSMNRPRFASSSGAGPRFSELSDGQLAAYRDVLRRALDEEVAAFDPQIIHCDRVWLFGHLALESGVPYVLVAHESELAEATIDHRYQRLVEEAVENAGRIVAPHDELARQIRESFGDSDSRIAIVPAVADSSSPLAIGEYVAALVKLYDQVLDERLGDAHRD